MTRSSAIPSLIRHWAAFVPILMSLAALLLVLGFGFILQPAPPEDEGTPARLYQLLMTVQIPIVAYFAILWMPIRLRAALQVLALQGLTWLAAIVALYIFEHT